jgi:molecular chaperone DnaK (HSP70)
MRQVDLDTGEIVIVDEAHHQNGLPHSISYDPDNPRLSVEQAIAIYHEAQDMKKRMTAEVDELIKHCKTVAEVGLLALSLERLVTEFGAAHMAGGQSRVSYNARQLEQLCQRDPVLAGKLEPCRTIYDDKRLEHLCERDPELAATLKNCRQETTTKPHIRFTVRGGAA